MWYQVAKINTTSSNLRCPVQRLFFWLWHSWLSGLLWQQWPLFGISSFEKMPSSAIYRWYRKGENEGTKSQNAPQKSFWFFSTLPCAYFQKSLVTMLVHLNFFQSRSPVAEVLYKPFHWILFPSAPSVPKKLIVGSHQKRLESNPESHSHCANR